MIQGLTKFGVLGFSFPALLVAGVVATETRSLFYWPACLLLGVAGVFMVLHGRWRLRSAPADICIVTTLGFASYLVWRDFHSPVISYAREDLFLVLGCGVTYALSATAMSDARLRIAVLWIMAALVIGNLAVSFIHISGHWRFHILPSYLRTIDSHRIGGFFNNPNHLAAFLYMAALLFLGMAILGGLHKGWRLLLGILTLACVLAVPLTVSRGALIGLGAGVSVLTLLSLWLLRRARPHLFLKSVFAVVVFLALAAFSLFSVFSERLDLRFVDGTRWDRDPRTVIWKAALAQYHMNPEMGAGGRMFYSGCITYRSPDSAPWMKDALFAHNEYLQMLADYGWIGLTLAILFVLAHLGNGWRYLRWFVRERLPSKGILPEKNLGFAVGSLAALCALLVHACFEFHFHVPAIALPAAFLFGIMANPGIENPARKPLRLPLVRPLWKLALIASGAWMAWGACTVGRADYCLERAVLSPVKPDADLTRILWLTKGLEIDPLNDALWYDRGLARKEAAAGKTDVLARPILKLAASDLEAARGLNSTDMFMALDLADVYDGLNATEDAERCLRDALRLAPLFMEPRLSVAVHYHRQGRYSEAEQGYLWASDATAGRDDQWIGLYKQLLQDALPR